MANTLGTKPTVTPLAPAIGARVEGVDIAAGVSDEDFAVIRDALHRYSVVVLPRQQLTPKAEADFAARLGPLRESSVLNKYGHAECADITVLSNIVENGEPIGISDAGMLWHTDASYSPRPSMYSMLYALQVPRAGGRSLGNTLYSSTGAAYEALPDETKRKIQDLKAVHSYAWHIEKKRRLGQLTRPPLTQAEMDQYPDQTHPLVRTHPVTGRKSIYASEGHTARLEGVPDAEAAELLERLLAQIRKDEFIYTHSWTEGDLVIWDNCAVQHLATKDYGDIPRRMHQTGTEGTPPV